jgi:hypothetical protein
MILFAISSEYDYYFTSLDPASPVFGHVIAIVNNCGEESPPIPSSTFLDAMIAYTKVNIT